MSRFLGSLISGWRIQADSLLAEINTQEVRIPHGHMFLQLSTRNLLFERTWFEPSVHCFSANHVPSFHVYARQGTEEDINSDFTLIESSKIFFALQQAKSERRKEAGNQHQDTKMKLLCALVALSFSFATCKVVKYKDCGSEYLSTLFALPHQFM